VKNNDPLCGMFEILRTGTDTFTVKVLFSLIMFIWNGVWIESYLETENAMELISYFDTEKW